MKVVITGGGGFLGNQLARALTKRGTLTGPSGQQEPIDHLTLFDKFIPNDRLEGLENAEAVSGDIADRDTVFSLIDRDDIAIFHLASMVSGECEVEFDDALAVNLDGGRHLLEAARALDSTPRLVFASSIAAYGGAVMPAAVGDSTKRSPQTTYGVTKVICELLINDYSRKGFLDGRGARLPTVIVRPGKPNTAASSFASGMFREPLAGQPHYLPVHRSQKVPVIGYRTVIDSFIALHELDTEAMGDDRIFTLPSVEMTVAEMVQVLEQVAVEKGIKLGPIEDRPDAVIQRIVDGWPVATDGSRALSCGLPPVGSLEAILEGYLEDFG